MTDRTRNGEKDLMRVLRLIVLTVVIATGTFLVGRFTVSAVSSRTNELTQGGQLRLSLELLLRRSLGAGTPEIQVTSSNIYNFNCVDCSPLATEQPFVYIFKTDSSKLHFHLVRVSNPLKLYFGNYGTVVAIKGELIECGASDGQVEYLFEYGDTSNFTLGCATPSPYP